MEKEKVKARLIKSGLKNEKEMHKLSLISNGRDTGYENTSVKERKLAKKRYDLLKKINLKIKKMIEKHILSEDCYCFFTPGKKPDFVEGKRIAQVRKTVNLKPKADAGPVEWKSLNINFQNIEHSTGKAVLIKCPNNSAYAGCVFWHPSKLIKPGRHGGAVSVLYNDNFVFHLKKYGHGKYNWKQVIYENDICTDEFEEMFKAMDENIVGRNWKDPYETNKPLPVEPVESKVNEALLDA